MAKTVKDAYSEILRLRNEFYQKWQEVPHEVYDENRNTYKAKYEAFDKALELLTPSIVDPQPEEPMTADKVNLDRCIYDIDLVASGREDLEKELDRYLPSVFNKNMDGGNPKFATWYKALRKTAVHVANWQREQIMKDAKEYLEKEKSEVRRHRLYRLIDERLKNEEDISSKMKVITLCGSTRFKEQFLEQQKRLTLEGNIVISVGLFGHSGDEEVWKPGMKEMLDKMHLQKIDMADEIFVINVGGYIGESTRREIAHAEQTGKPVRYLENKNI